MTDRPAAIRPGTVGDIPAVLPLVARTITFHEELDAARFAAAPDAYRRYDTWFTRTVGSDAGVFLVAEDEGRIVGFIFGQVQEEYQMYRVGRYGMLHELWVEPAFRRNKLAMALVLEALESFRRAGVSQVRLDTGAGNEAAQRLFAACGFRPSMIEMLAELRSEE